MRFPDYIQESIAASDAALVVIGPHWVNASAGLGRRRLDDPADFVRIEIETALRLGVAVVPLLVSGATPPPERRLPPSLRPLLEQNGLAVRQDPDFSRDMERVFAAVDYWQAQPRRPVAIEEEPAPALVEEEPVETPAPAVADAIEQASAAALPAAPAQPARGGSEGRGRAWVVAISALLVVAIAVAALLSGVGKSLLAGITGPSASAVKTQTQGTQVAQAHATQTETARLARLPYAPAGAGPCDPGEQLDAGSSAARTAPAYWSESPSVDVTCASDGTTAVLGHNSASATVEHISFYGVPANYAFTNTGFPRNFTLALDMDFTSAQPEYNSVTNTDSYCVMVDVQAAGTSSEAAGANYHAVQVCRDGSWSAGSIGNNPIQRTPLITAPLAFTITVKDNALTITVNGTALLDATPLNGTGVVAEVDMYLFSGQATHGATLTRFVMTPQ